MAGGAIDVISEESLLEFGIERVNARKEHSNKNTP
jgi:hypothetical protein